MRRSESREEYAAEVSWINQPGRLPSQMSSLADGFAGSGAIASLVVVAEVASGSRSESGTAVSVFRDSFAEGIAYGVEDVFRDTLQETAERGVDDSFSLAVAVSLDGDVWIFSRGGCSAFAAVVEEGVRTYKLVRKDEIVHLRMDPGQSVLLVSEGLKGISSSAGFLKSVSSCRTGLESCLRKVIDESRIRFRTRGGSAASLRICSAGRKRKLKWAFRSLYTVLAALLAYSAFFILCSDAGESEHRSSPDAYESTETVMPID